MASENNVLHRVDVQVKSRLPSLRKTSVRGNFFAWMALVNLSFVVLGFAPTYFLRKFYGSTELAFRIHIHGILFTAWYLIFFLQIAFISGRRLDLHRRLGWIGSLLALTMTIVALWMNYRFAMGSIEEDGVISMTKVFGFWGNLHLTISFAVFVGLAVHFRKKPEAHKRLMLLASISMLPAALIRIAGFRSVSLQPALVTFACLLALLLAPITYDLITRRKAHPASLWGAVLYFLSLVVFGAIIPTTEFGRSVVAAIG